MEPGKAVRIAEAYIDYFLPREVIGPVFLIFSLENIIEILFNKFLLIDSELYGWIVIFFSTLVVIAVWGSTDTDMEELEEEIDEIEAG